MSVSEAILQELRAAKPVAPEALRDRVRALEAKRPRQLPLRPLALAAAPAVVAVGLTVAVVHGLVSSGSQPVRNTAAPKPKFLPNARARSPFVPSDQPTLRSAESLPPPNGQRLQRYEAWLSVRVKDHDALSRATQQAMRTTRLLGGYVAFVGYNVPGERSGQSRLILRVPIAHVQEAIESFSGLGSVVAERISIKDVEREVAEQTKLIARIATRIHDLREQLRKTTDPYARAELKAKLDLLASRLKLLEQRRKTTLRRAEFARISLTLATKKKAAAPGHPGRFDRTMSDAGSVLVRELELLVYALIVAGPLLLLGGAILFSSRAVRRRADERLLTERP